MSSIFEGLVSVYHLNSGFEDSWGGKNMTAYGAVIDSSSKLGAGCALFDGVDDYAEVALASTIVHSAFTLSVWVNHTSLSSWYENYFSLREVAVGTPPNSGAGIRLKGDTSQVQAYIVTGGVFSDILTTAPTVGTWYHYLTTYDGSVFKFYVNNSLVSSISKTGTLYTNYILLSRSDLTLNGRADEAVFWNRALTDAERNYLYHNGLGIEIRNIRQGIDYGIGRGIAA